MRVVKEAALKGKVATAAASYAACRQLTSSKPVNSERMNGVTIRKARKFPSFSFSWCLILPFPDNTLRLYSPVLVSKVANAAFNKRLEHVARNISIQTIAVAFSMAHFS